MAEVEGGKALRDVPVFAGLDDDALERIAAVATEASVQSGHVLIERGQEGSGLFLILEGSVQIQLPDGTIERGAGECLGELALLVDGLRRTARVQATAPTRFLAIRRDDFKELLESEPRIAVAMLPVLAKRQAESIMSA